MTGSFSLNLFDGGHFFFFENDPGEIAERLALPRD